MSLLGHRPRLLSRTPAPLTSNLLCVSFWVLGQYQIGRSLERRTVLNTVEASGQLNWLSIKPIC